MVRGKPYPSLRRSWGTAPEQAAEFILVTRCFDWTGDKGNYYFIASVPFFTLVDARRAFVPAYLL